MFFFVAAIQFEFGFLLLFSTLNVLCFFCFYLDSELFIERERERKKEICLRFYYFLASLLYLSISILPIRVHPSIHTFISLTFIRSFVRSFLYLIVKVKHSFFLFTNGIVSIVIETIVEKAHAFLSLESTRVGSIRGLIYLNETVSGCWFLFSFLKDTIRLGLDLQKTWGGVKGGPLLLHQKFLPRVLDTLNEA
jgi:hypothetical protein